jgi:hypothetical protein
LCLTEKKNCTESEAELCGGTRFCGAFEAT